VTGKLYPTRNEAGHQWVDYTRQKERRPLRNCGLIKRGVPFLERKTPWGLEAQIVADAPTRQVVLIVEDEALVRMAAVDMIEEAGFEVLEATNADEAILLLEAGAT
jgi:hypothetical protein